MSGSSTPKGPTQGHSAWNISAWAIKNPIIPFVFFIGICFAGLLAYARLPVNQLPNIEFPGFMVTVAQPGAAPTEIESQITQRVEASLQAVEGVRRVYSTVNQGVTNTTVILHIGTDVTKAVDDARDVLSRLRSDLPRDIEEPVITREDAASDPIATYAVEAPTKTSEQLSWYVENDLARELQGVAGVSSVRRLGGVDREIRIELDPKQLLSFGITAAEVNNQLTRLNVNLPGGRAEVGGQGQTIRTMGAAASVSDLAETRMVLGDGRSVRLGDLGTIRDGNTDISTLSRFNGQPAVGLQILRAKTASEVQTFDLTKAKLDELTKRDGVTFRYIGGPIEFVKGMHKSAIASILEGALLAVIVVFVILKDWRATVIAAFAIPLSIVPTFAVMESMGFTLNMMTLIALGLVAGVLVDDAIVEIENTVRHMRMGKTPYQAAMDASDEIGLAVVATTATIVAVFLPVAMMGSTTGQFFKAFGLTVAVAVLFSLLVARLITPVMAAYFLKNKGHEEKRTWLMDRYDQVLRFTIKRPFVVFIAGILVFVASMTPVATGRVPFTDIPRLDNGIVNLNVEFSPGTPIPTADTILKDMTRVVSQEKEVSGVFATVNGSEGVASGGTLIIALVDRSERSRSSYDIQQAIRPKLAVFPDVRTAVVNFQGGGAGADVTLEFVGRDPAAVEAASDALVKAMKTKLSDRLADIQSSAALKRPEIQITPKQDVAAQAGVSPADLAIAVRIATGGEVDQNTAKYNLTDRQVPIRVLMDPSALTDLATIQALRVRSATGEAVRLDSVADIKFGLGDSTLERRDRERKVTVEANVTKGEIGNAVNDVLALPEAKNLPPGVSIQRSGSAEQQQEMFSDFGNAMMWGGLLIYFVLVLLFKDFFQPITIMMAFPLSIGGAFVGLWLSGQPVSIFALVGFLMLMGIVTKNSILLVDYAVEGIRAGKSRNAALLEAGEQRARPIIMTTIAMSAGMLPTALGTGVDGALRQGMGWAVIGGLMLSTLLSLVFVPAVFILVDRLERLVVPFFSKISTRTEGDDKATTVPAE
jgi:hydrophobe/amphiphile efflux-1 (HAE1) family protein